MKHGWNKPWKFEHKTEQLKFSASNSPFHEIFTLISNKDALVIRQDEPLKIRIKEGLYNLPPCGNVQFVEVDPLKSLHIIYNSEPIEPENVVEISTAVVTINIKLLRQDKYQITIDSTYTTFFSSREYVSPTIQEVLSRKKLLEKLSFIQPKVDLGVFSLPLGTCFSKK